MSHRNELKWPNTAAPGPAQSLVGYNNAGSPVDIAGVRWDSILNILKIIGSFQVQFTDKVKLLVKRGFTVTGSAFDASILEDADVAVNSVITAFGFVQGVKETDGAGAFGGIISAVFRKDVSGVVTQVGATQTILPVQEDQPIGTPTPRFQVLSPSITIGFTNPAASYNYVVSAFCILHITSE